MAVAYDTTVTGINGGGGTVSTSSGITTGGTNRLLIAIVAILNSSSQTVSSVAGGGLTWKNLSGATISNGTTIRIEAWVAYASSTLTSQTITATLSANAFASIVVSAYTGTQADAVGDALAAIGAWNATTAAGTSSATGVVTTIADNSLVIGGIALNVSTTVSAGAGESVNGQMSTNPTLAQTRQNAATSPVGSVTMDWSWSGAATQAKFALELKVLTTPSVTAKWMTDGGDSTGDISEWSNSSGLTAQTGTVKTGSYAFQITFPNASDTPWAAVDAILADAGRRLSFYLRVSALPAATTWLVGPSASGGFVNPTFGLKLNTFGNLVLTDGTTSVTGSTALSANTFYRITFCYLISSGSVQQFRVFIDDSATAEIASVNPFTALTTGRTSLTFGQGGTGVTANTNVFLDSIYVDDGITLDNPSTNGLGVTRKAPNATGTNNAFDTQIGSFTNRWDGVNEVPISTAKGWEQVGSSQVIEAYGIQSASQGDVDITGATLLGWKAWLSGKGQAVTTGEPKATALNNGKATGTTLTLGAVDVTVGDVVVVMFADLVGGAAPTIADNLVNTWTALSGPTTNGVRCNKWRSPITVAGSMTVTITFGSSALARAGALGVWDVAYIGALDKNIANANDNTTPYDCPSSGTLAQADEIVLGFVFINGPVASLAAATSPDAFVGGAASGTTGGSATTNASVAMTWRKVTATTAVAPQVTGTSRTGVVGTASYRITPIVAGTPKLVDNGVDVAITLTGTQTFYSNVDTSASYPSNGNTIGMKSTGGAMDTFLYECGIQIAYIPAVVTTGQPMWKRWGGMKTTALRVPKRGRVSSW